MHILHSQKEEPFQTSFAKNEQLNFRFLSELRADSPRIAAELQNDTGIECFLPGRAIWRGPDYPVNPALSSNAKIHAAATSRTTKSPAGRLPYGSYDSPSESERAAIRYRI